ncbi:MAG: hypothetical protein ACI845_002822 [Gammaproteobacteria bacterium]|jgi:hypothetical protein
MSLFIKLRMAIIVFGFALFNSAQAVEPLTTEELVSHCNHYAGDPGGKDGIFCVRYVQGFLDGAVATDERVTLNVAAEYGKEETFSERAARNRLGVRLSKYGPSVYADFCLGEPVPLADVVQKVVNDLQNTALVKNLPSARDLVYMTVRTQYPCDDAPTGSDS